MTTGVAAGNCFVESEFFDRAEILWEQIGRSVTGGESESSHLRRVGSSSAYTLLLATADQVFTQDLTLAFLNRIRRWGRETLGARHASTPQVHIYVEGCRRALAPDAPRTRRHYLYSLTRSETAIVRLLEEDGFQKKWFRISVNRVANFQLRFNQFLVHETHQAYAIEGPQRAALPLEGMILLHGYLW